MELESLRRELVALKRSIDFHETDPKRYVILRSDFDPIWHRLVDIVEGNQGAHSASDKP